MIRKPNTVYVAMISYGKDSLAMLEAIKQLRLLRKNYPEYWKLLLKWDSDSPVTFHPDGHTVHDFDRRFSLEDVGAVPKDRKFRWWMIEQYQLSLF